MTDKDTINKDFNSKGQGLDERRLKALLPQPFKSSYIRVYDEIGSTNDQAKLAMDKGQDSLVIAAKYQSKGRGKRQRSFYSPHGGLYFSFAYRPSKKGAMPKLETLAAGYASSLAFSQLYGADIQLKWVNDLTRSGKKVAGILTEGQMDFEKMSLDYLIVGIGINISKPKEGYPPEIRKLAGPVFDKVPEDFDPNQVIARIIYNYMTYKDKSNLLDLYKTKWQDLNRPVKARRAGKIYHGLARDINDQGNLIIQVEDGSLVEATSSL